MLRTMRKNASSFFIKIILGAIVVVFVFLGLGSYNSGKLSRVAVVNGDSISIDEYQQAYHNMVEHLRQQFGNNLNEEMIQYFQVKQQALDTLINKYLMLQQCDRLNLRVTDAEVADTIKQIPVFRTNGTFDPKLYEMLLRQNRLTPEIFETSQRETLLIDQLKALVIDNVKVSEVEAQEWFQWNHARINLDFVHFSPDSYNDMNPSEEAVKQFFENHAEQYKTEAMINAHYLKFDPKNYVSQINITPAEIEDYYNTNPDQFRTPKMVEARHILIKADPDAAPELIKQAKLRAEKIYREALTHKDFGDLAKQYSEGPTKEHGGYLGKFTKEKMVKPFAEKAFSMKAGDISEPVRTRFGWHVIKIENVYEETVKTLAEVESDIRKKLTDEKSRELAYDEAEAVFELADEGSDLDGLAALKNIETMKVDFFTRQGPQELAALRTDFAAAAFELADHEISEITELNGAYYIIQRLETHAPSIPELKDVKESVESDVLKQMQDRKAFDDAKIFFDELKKIQSISETADKIGKRVESTGFFERSESIPGIGFEKAIIDAAFSLTAANPYPQTIQKGRKGYFIVALKEKEKPDNETFNKQKEKIIEELLSRKKNQVFLGWLQHLKDTSNIKIEKSFENLM